MNDEDREKKKAQLSRFKQNSCNQSIAMTTQTNQGDRGREPFHWGALGTRGQPQSLTRAAQTENAGGKPQGAPLTQRKGEKTDAPRKRRTNIPHFSFSHSSEKRGVRASSRLTAVGQRRRQKRHKRANKAQGSPRVLLGQ